MSSSPPTTLGKYQIIREIARSNDIVYEAYDPLMNRRVALKELSIPGGSTSQQKEDRVKRFQREVKAAGSLAHPNIVTIYEVGEESGRNYMAMEFLDGHTLRNELDTRGFLDQVRALEIAIEILSGLEFAHDHGVIHRDVKPENIQLLDSGHVKLTDFGIARLTFEPNITIDGQVFGTPSYMSPEQVVGKDIDCRSDLFSVGVILYEMIAGKKPFSGDSVFSTTHAIMNTHPEMPAQINYSIWQVVERALDKSAGNRWQTAKEMRVALDMAKAALTSGQIVGSPFGATVMGAAPAVVPPPVSNPYAPQQPQQPMSTYGFNPYQAQQGTQGGQPYVPYQPQAPYQLPVYYPPPPRQPVFKPETKRFLGRLFLTLLILGSLFALLIVGVNAISSSLQNYRADSYDYETKQQLRGLASNPDIDDRIRRSEALISKLRNATSRAEETRKLAPLYESVGSAAMRVNDLEKAEASYRRAIECDPDSASLQTNLGDLYARMAAGQATPEQAAELWRQSGDCWARASGLSGSPEERRRFSEAAANALFNAAFRFSEANETSRARSTLYDARRFAPTGSEVERRVLQLLDQLSG